MKFGSALSVELREKYKKRSFRAKKGDSVKIVRGEFKGIEGKITKIDAKKGKVYVEGVTTEKIKGGTPSIPIDASKVIITTLNLDDKPRKAKLESE
jgi:large subunit ribosomal protein L24